MFLTGFAKTYRRRGLTFITNHPRFRQHSVAMIRRLGLYGGVCALYDFISLRFICGKLRKAENALSGWK